MSNDQMTAVMVTATRHIVGIAFARGNTSPKALPPVEILVGKDGYQTRVEDTGDDLFKIPTSELSTALVTYERAAFTAASLVALSFTGADPNDRLFYQVVPAPGSKPDAPITSGTASPITTPNSASFSIAVTGVTVTLPAAAAVPTVATGVWVLLWSSPDTVLVAPGKIDANLKTTTVPFKPSNPDPSASYAALGLVAGYAPKFKSSGVTLAAPTF